MEDCNCPIVPSCLLFIRSRIILLARFVKSFRIVQVKVIFINAVVGAISFISSFFTGVIGMVTKDVFCDIMFVLLIIMFIFVNNEAVAISWGSGRDRSQFIGIVTAAAALWILCLGVLQLWHVLGLLHLALWLYIRWS